MNWKGYEWIVGFPWGITHENNKLCWYGEPAISKAGDALWLSLENCPKEFNGVTKPICAGLVSCKQSFKYGTFTWRVTMPCGPRLWPALWLASEQEWPPEIDVMEAYTDKESSYRKCLLFIDVHPSVHWKSEEGSHKVETKNNILASRVKGCSPWNGLPVEEFKCEWTKEHVKIYYNGVLIKTFDDPEMLSHLNRPDISMYPVMNLQPRTGFVSEEDLSKIAEDFIVWDFKWE